MAIGIAALIAGACADAAPAGPTGPSTSRSVTPALGSPSLASSEIERTLAELRRVTARYHDVGSALADGFGPAPFGCEVLATESGAETHIGIPYVNHDRITDGVLDPSRPDVLLYEPESNGRRTLVAAALATPVPMWQLSHGTEPPDLFGVPFQLEPGPGIYGLHIWIWRHNPRGMFAIGNPRVTCDLAE